MALFRLALKGLEPDSDWTESPWASFEEIGIGISYAFSKWMEIHIPTLKEVNDQTLQEVADKFTHYCKIQKLEKDKSIQDQPLMMKQVSPEVIKAMASRPSTLH